MSRIVVLGGSFAGLTAALEVKRKLREQAEVTVVSRSEHFVFIPSLIWVPFGWRRIEQITVPLAPILNRVGIRFLHASAARIEAEANRVETTAGWVPYDYLVIATGPDLDMSIPGLDPNDPQTACICTPRHALQAQQAWKALLDDPGPVVIGAAPGAGCTGAAYEFLFNMDDALRRAGIRKKVELTWVTPEPYLGHFGIDGMPGGERLLKAFMRLYKIGHIVNANIERLENHTVHLSDGTRLPYRFAMIMPKFRGAEVVRNSPGIGNERGFVPVLDNYRHRDYPNIFAAGIAVDVPPPFPTPVPLGVPKTGFPADEAGKTVAENITRLVRGQGRLKEKPFGRIPGLCVMDAGHKEVLLLSNHLFKPRQFAILIPNPFFDVSKRLFEKYFLWKIRHGLAYLP